MKIKLEYISSKTLWRDLQQDYISVTISSSNFRCTETYLVNAFYLGKVMYIIIELLQEGLILSEDNTNNQ